MARRKEERRQVGSCCLGLSPPRDANQVCHLNIAYRSIEGAEEACGDDLIAALRHVRSRIMFVCAVAPSCVACMGSLAGRSTDAVMANFEVRCRNGYLGLRLQVSR